ncbi:MAG: competence/damage-inducible protein A [Phycisphaerales bacterium]|nr:competence/damage-inducible protein A [Phycisphaerales bacterium]
MQAATISIGDELVLGQTQDTNGAWLARALIERGIRPMEHCVVADNLDQLSDTIRTLARRFDVVVMTGGLGPTEDDLTREALANVVTPGRDCVVDDDALAVIEAWRARVGRSAPATNRHQAMRPASMRCLPNPHGTAPGLIGTWNACVIAALPGPPREMTPMFLNHVVGELPKAPDHVVRTATVLSYGLGESRAAVRIRDMMDRDRHPLVGTTASGSIITARIRAEGRAAEIMPLLSNDVEAIEHAWLPYAFGSGDDTLAGAVMRALLPAGRTCATAESCTGGLLGAMIVDLPGSSAVYAGGWVTYTNAMKTSCLGVPTALLDAHGAVSAPVAEAMANGARERSGATYAMSITGVAGPDGGSEEKPVGTVHIGLATPDGTRSRCFRFPGDRSDVRDRSAKSALQMLRFELLGVTPDQPLLWDATPREAAPA